MRRVLPAAAVFLACLCATAFASAESVWWVDEASPMSHAALDGSGGTTLGISGPAGEYMQGIAIDPANGRVYWSNWSSGEIASVPLAGGVATELDTGSAIIHSPDGIALDPAAGRIYWASNQGGPGNNGAIGYANLDGSGDAGNLNVGGSQISNPWGIALDPVGGRIYWANYSNSTISYANLDGSGGGVLNTSGAIPSGPRGVAIDPTTRRIFWANGIGSSIGWANLDGSASGSLNTAGATVEFPTGIAFDAASGRVYWNNAKLPGGVISSARADGTGGGADLPTPGASPKPERALMAIFRAPASTAPPVITSNPLSPSTLSCSTGGWEEDPGSQVYRAPQSFSYEWLKDGARVGGVDATLAAGGAGTYVCRVRAENAEGSAVATSAAFVVGSPSTLPTDHGTAAGSIRVSKVRLNRHRGSAVLMVLVSGPGSVRLTGKRIVAGTAIAQGAGVVKLRVRAQGRAKRKLAVSGKARVKARLTFLPTGAAPVHVDRKLTLRRDAP